MKGRAMPLTPPVREGHNVVGARDSEGVEDLTHNVDGQRRQVATGHDQRIGVGRRQGTDQPADRPFSREKVVDIDSRSRSLVIAAYDIDRIDHVGKDADRSVEQGERIDGQQRLVGSCLLYTSDAADE